MSARKHMIHIGIAFTGFILFLFFQAQGIGSGDSGDLVTAAYLFGVPHPPGYPLYTFLGWLLSRIPLFTVAWRVALLSSLSHAVVIGIVFLIVEKLTRKRRIALFACILLVANYLFFLYSISAEVFALFDLFVIVLFYLGLLWLDTKKIQYAYAGSFLFGLSLTHHHVILFFVPALLYLFIHVLRTIPSRQRISIVLKMFGLFCIGLIPYIYVVIAAGGTSVVNWDTPNTLPRFIRLITRADYGTFQATGMLSENIVTRLIQIKAYLRYILMDYTSVGVLFACAGLIGLWRRKRKVFYFIGLAVLCLGPLFLFYAGFPLMNNFMLGTVERFLLPSYMFITILISYGVFFSLDILGQRLKIFRTLRIQTALLFVLFLYPAVLGYTTLWKFTGWRTDTTAENLGRDILSPLPYGSLVLIGRDTSLFTSQYVRYVQNFRPDVTFIHLNLLTLADYRRTIQKLFPAVRMPENMEDRFMAEFVVQNSIVFPVFSNVRYILPDGWYWIPYGLVYELVNKDSLPSISMLKESNNAVWEAFHDPNSGILKRYNHLMLTDVRDVYSTGRVEYGKVLLRAQDFLSAKDQFRQAIAAGGEIETPTALMYLGLSEYYLKECEAAISHFQESRKYSYNTNPLLNLYEGATYRDCLGDAAKAKQFLDEYAAYEKGTQIRLDQL
jgi:tetratricopeptide (TPR) repeat protein